MATSSMLQNLATQTLSVRFSAEGQLSLFNTHHPDYHEMWDGTALKLGHCVIKATIEHDIDNHLFAVVEAVWEGMPQHDAEWVLDPGADAHIVPATASTSQAA